VREKGVKFAEKQMVEEYADRGLKRGEKEKAKERKSRETGTQDWEVGKPGQVPAVEVTSPWG